MDTPHESTNPSAEAPPPEPPPSGNRREFLKSAACVALGGACVLAPLAVGVTVVLGPLRLPPADGLWVHLTQLNGLTLGAGPRLFQVFIERSDAWTRHGRNAVGSVF